MLHQREGVAVRAAVAEQVIAAAGPAETPAGDPLPVVRRRLPVSGTVIPGLYGRGADIHEQFFTRSAKKKEGR